MTSTSDLLDGVVRHRTGLEGGSVKTEARADLTGSKGFTWTASKFVDWPLLGGCLTCPPQRQVS